MIRKYLLLFNIIFFSCSDFLLEDERHLLFRKIDPDRSGIKFKNEPVENDSLNIIFFEYLYNGGGVAIGDINNDKLPDIYFSGTQVSNKLYLNKGNFRFEDITEQAGVSTDNWSTGVLFVDINGDNFMDIFVSQTNKLMYSTSENLLFINNKDNTFTEMAEEYGLSHSPDLTHAAFFDYDLDGDLDCFFLVHQYDAFNPNKIRPRRIDGTAPNTDILMRNEGINKKTGHPHFTDVSAESGILNEGYGLGVNITDINRDGWPDIYVANDYLSNDVFYINNQDGTFTNRIDEMISHQSNSAMGCDIADINNDGWFDIITLDMLPRDNFRRKMMIGDVNIDKYEMQMDFGYEPQYVRNMLQLNRGPINNDQLFFSEIGQFADIHSTGWSWSSLFADFDQDGKRDLFISNGIPKDLTNLDLIDYREKVLSSRGFSYQTYVTEIKNYMAQVPDLDESNFIFKNIDGLNFSDVSGKWGLDEYGSSNGAAYADLDIDGDLDLVVNNLNKLASIYENTGDSAIGHYLKIDLHGITPNTKGLGSRVEVFAEGRHLFAEQNPYRGFQSSVDPTLHFGLGNIATIDSIIVHWTTSEKQQYYDIKSDTTLVVFESDNLLQPQNNRQYNKARLADVQFSSLNLANHKERDFNDFKINPLLPTKYSKLGPGIAVGDINSDGLDDIYIGGAYGQIGTFYTQSTTGWVQRNLIAGGASKGQEDMGTLLFDADGDDDLDLYVVSGSTEFGGTSSSYQDRLYINKSGQFHLNKDLLPKIQVSGSCVKAADFDKDGDLDVFRGSRINIYRYPEAPPSYIFENIDGKFNDVTEAVAPLLQDIGMVSDGLWTDINDDGWLDLILVGEWMPITILVNNQGLLTEKIVLPHSGFWNSLAAGDFDNDGDTDYVIGNLGKNSPYQISNETPMTITQEDINGDKAIDGIISAYLYDAVDSVKEVPVHPRRTLAKRIIQFNRTFKDYQSYAEIGSKQLFTDYAPLEKERLKATEQRSIYLENLGNFKFNVKALPDEAQLFPIYGIVPYDLDYDGYLDLILAGNTYNSEPLHGNYDAGSGLILKGDGNGNFRTSLDNQIFIPGDTKGLALVRTTSGFSLVAGRNDDTALVYQLPDLLSTYQVYKPNNSEISIRLSRDNNTKRKTEFYYGSGYLSNSSRYAISKKKKKKKRSYSSQE